MIEIIAQIIGIVGMILTFLSFQCKKTRNLFIFQVLGGVAFTVNFFMLGSLTGAFLNTVNIIRGIVFGFSPKKNQKVLCVFVILLYIAVSAATYSGGMTLLITFAQLIGTISMMSGSGQIIRAAQFFVVSPAWLIHNIYFWSLGGILCECFSFISIIVSVIRYGINGFDKK